MPTYKTHTKENKDARPLRPALTPEGRENQLISLAVDQAEKELREGTASSQVLTHFLKLASSKNSLEESKLKAETALLEARKKDIESNQYSKTLYDEALKAFRSYSGQDIPKETTEDPTLDLEKK